jgi:hypothetical protein
VRVPHFSKWIHSVGILYPGTTGHRLWPNNLVTTGSSSGKMVVGPNTRSKSLRPWPDDYGMWARKVSDQARRNLPKPKTTHQADAHQWRMAQKAGSPIYINPAHGMAWRPSRANSSQHRLQESSQTSSTSTPRTLQNRREDHGSLN